MTLGLDPLLLSLYLTRGLDPLPVKFAKVLHCKKFDESTFFIPSVAQKPTGGNDDFYHSNPRSTHICFSSQKKLSETRITLALKHLGFVFSGIRICVR
jgi:hypothetical protein